MRLTAKTMVGIWAGSRLIGLVVAVPLLLALGRKLALLTILYGWGAFVGAIAMGFFAAMILSIFMPEFSWFWGLCLGAPSLYYGVGACVAGSPCGVLLLFFMLPMLAIAYAASLAGGFVGGSIGAILVGGGIAFGNRKSGGPTNASTLSGTRGTPAACAPVAPRIPER